MIWFWAALLALGLLVLVPAALRAGRGLAPVRRRLVVSTSLALLATVPALPTLAMPWTVARGLGTTWGVTEDGTRIELPDEPQNGEIDLAVVVLGWWVAVCVAVKSLRMPPQFRHIDRMRPVADAALVARIEQLAGRLRLAPPRVLQPGSIDGGMEMFAFATGLLVPVVVVSDGIGHRLSERERDAVIAHELAHLSLRHVHRALLGYVGIALASVFVSGFVPCLIGMLWMISATTFFGAWRGHRIELAADREAGRVVGHGVVASGLDKVHVAYELSDTSPWLHALVSHPSLSVRAFHLANDAPADERGGIVVDHAKVERSQMARRIAMTAWGSLLVLVIWLGNAGHQVLAGVIAATTSLLPLVLRLVFLGHLRETMQLGLGSLPGRVLRRLLLLVVAFALMAVSPLLPDESPIWPMLLGLSTVLLVVAAVLGGRREWRAKAELRSRLHEGDLKGYLQGCERLRPRWRRRPEHRLQEALVRAAIGDRTAARAELERLAADCPRYLLVLARLAREWRSVQPAESLRVARTLVGRLPNHSLARGVLAGCLLYAGELDEAWENIERVVKSRPQLGGWQALRARIALARGDVATAQAALDQAERLAPGDPATVLAQAEFSVTTRAADVDARMAKLRELHRALPLDFLGEDLARLEKRLSGASSSLG